MDRLVLVYEPTVFLIFLMAVGVLIGYLVGKHRDIAPATVVATVFGGISSVPAITGQTITVFHTIATIISVLAVGYGIGALIKTVGETREMAEQTLALVRAVAEKENK